MKSLQKERRLDQGTKFLQWKTNSQKTTLNFPFYWIQSKSRQTNSLIRIALNPTKFQDNKGQTKTQLRKYIDTKGED